MEEENSMTVESLRARLLSERSISKAERERADLLAQRVLELEGQLKVVSLQRRKAEKAVTDVLAIFADLRRNHLLDGLDSNSELDESPKADSSSNGSILSKETLTNLKSTDNESEALSGSGFEYSPNTGRNLPWRNTKDPSQSPEKKTFMDLTRKRAINSSSGSSARRMGKSHRRIRRRDTRSIDEFQNKGYEDSMCSTNDLNCSGGESPAHKEGSEHGNSEKQQGNPLVSNDPVKDSDSQYFDLSVRDDNVEKACQHQPEQLVCQLDREKKAWKENIAVYNGSIQDSFDPTNHSDVMQEQCEMKPPETSPSFAIATLVADQQIANELPGFIENPQVHESSPSTTNPDKRTVHDQQQRASLLSGDSSTHEFSFPVSSEQTDQTPHHENSPTSWHIGNCSEIPNNVAATLQELLQAKMLLSQESNSLASVDGNIFKSSSSGTGKEDGFELPFVTSALFRIPVDYEPEVAGGSDAQPRGSLGLDLVDHSPELLERNYLSSAGFESRRASTADAFGTVYSATEYWHSPLVDPATTHRMNNVGALHYDRALPSERNRHPFL